jgi:hypothetical protein
MEWVSVGERLPDESSHMSYVPVWIKDRNKPMWLRAWYVHTLRAFFAGNENITRQVSHWCPITPPAD